MQDSAIQNSCQVLFLALRHTRSVRRSVPRHALLTLIRSLVVSSVDYCNSVLAGVCLAIFSTGKHVCKQSSKVESSLMGKSYCVTSRK